jgi:hypothetical protein
MLGPVPDLRSEHLAVLVRHNQEFANHSKLPIVPMATS